jgi:sugar lactone lactonase YvrE
MRGIKEFLLFSLAMSLGLGNAAADGTSHVLASYPGPTFLENLTVAEDSKIYVTNYSAKSVETISPEGVVATWARLDVHPVSIVATMDGFVVAAHARPFFGVSSFLGSGQLLFLDPDGTLREQRALPEVLFANGMIALEDGRLLIADSVGAQILIHDPATSTTGVWMADPAMAAQTDPFRPGVNGLKMNGGDLLLSSSAGNSLFKVELDPNGEPASGLEEIARDLPGADDFLVLPEGGFIVATHGATIIQITSDGSFTTIFSDERIKGSTAVALLGTGAERQIIVTATGGFSEGLDEDAFVMAVDWPAPATAEAQ